MIQYENKDYICFLDLGMDILRKKWKAVILCHLKGEPVRFLELQRKTPGVSQKILTQALKELEKEGFVLKTIFPEVPPKVEYSLTPKGREITTLLVNIEKWFEKFYSSNVKKIS